MTALGAFSNCDKYLGERSVHDLTSAAMAAGKRLSLQQVSDEECYHIMSLLKPSLSNYC